MSVFKYAKGSEPKKESAPKEDVKKEEKPKSVAPKEDTYAKVEEDTVKVETEDQSDYKGFKFPSNV